MSRPLQLIGVSLPPGAGPAGRILAEVDRLQANRGVRVLDMLLVSKAADGTLVQSSFGGDEDFGDLVSRLFPFDGSDAGSAPTELWSRAQGLPADSAAAFLLVEQRWADGLFDLVEEEGGALLGAGFVTPELGVMIDAEVTAMEEAARAIVVAQAAEADAWLRAAAAAAEAGAAADQIRSSAAAEALSVLTEAGLVERAAAHEAADALRAAGLVIAAADEAAEQAIEADAAAVAAADMAAADAIAEDALIAEDAEARTADAVAAASVTPPEIRVLRYLSTDMTFALIADRLGITRGAAKSRAERAYRKLGVHSRVDAVARARALRLIPSS